MYAKKKYHKCRLCLCKSEFSYSLFKANLTVMIESLTSIKITSEDRFPTTCCETCLAHVHLAYRLQQKILKSDKMLREYFSIRKLKERPPVKQPIENVVYVESIVDENIVDESYADETIDDNADPDHKIVNDNADSNHINNCLVADEIDLTRVKVELEDMNDCESGLNSLDNAKSTFAQVDTIGSLDLSHSIFEVIDINKTNFNKTSLQSDSNLAKFNEVIKKRLEEKRRNQNLECTECNLKFDKKSSLSLHLKKHDVRTCTICHVSIRTDNFKKHFAMHSASKEICEICGKVAKNKESLRGHMFYQHKPDKEIYKCDDCGREFRHRYKYTMHIKKAHTGERNYQCEVCGKKFFTAFDTKKHVEMTHFKARPYICKYCKRGYSSRYALKTHIRQHTLETPFRCELCAAGFRQRVSLRTHLKSKHKITDKNILYGKTKLTCDATSKLDKSDEFRGTEIDYMKGGESNKVNESVVEEKLEYAETENDENINDVNLFKSKSENSLPYNVIKNDENIFVQRHDEHVIYNDESDIT